MIGNKKVVISSCYVLEVDAIGAKNKLTEGVKGYTTTVKYKWKKCVMT